MKKPGRQPNPAAVPQHALSRLKKVRTMIWKSQRNFQFSM